MIIPVVLFIISLTLGQLGSIMVFPGVFVYVHDILLVLLVVASFILVVKSWKFRSGHLIIPILVFIAVAVLSLTVNAGNLPPGQVAAGSLYLWRWALYAFVYVIIIQRSVKSGWWIKIAYFAGCLFSVIGLSQYFLYPKLANLQYLGWDPHFMRLFSTFLDPNFAALFIVLTLLAGWYFWQDLPLWADIGLTGANVAALVLTYSRSGYLAFACGMVLWVTLTKKWRMLLIFAVFLLIFAAIPKSPLDVTRLDRTVSSIARIDNWIKSGEMAVKSPVIGFGFNTLEYLKNNPLHSGSGGFISRAGAGVDNSILFLIATTGAIGLISYGWLLVRMCLIRPGKKADAKFTKIRVLLLTSVAAVLVHSLFNNSLFYAWIMIWIWIVAGSAEIMADR
jgi:putative inorganic carbon (hco3(-)) transporter